MVVEEENRSMEEGLLLRHQKDINDRRITACVILSTFVAVCSSFSYGCAAGYTSGAETAIMKELDLSMAQFSAFGSFMNVGGAVGALFSGQLAVILGRRRENEFFVWLRRFNHKLIVSSLVHELYLMNSNTGQSWEDPTLSEWPENDYRLFCGDLGNEVNDDVLSKAFARFPTFNMAKLLQNSEISLIYFFGTVINWRVLAIIGALPCLLQVIGIFFIPESPRWLTKIGSSKEVESSLHQLRRKDTDVSGESAEIQVMTKMLEEDSKSSFSDMFQKKYRRTLVVGIGLMMIQQLSGASGITYYSNAIFRKAGLSERLGSMISGVFVIPKALVGLIFVDKWGRRPLLSQMNMLPELIGVLVFVNILVYFGFYAIGIGGLPWVIMSEYMVRMQLIRRYVMMNSREIPK